MNLFDMLRRGDRNLVTAGDVTLAKSVLSGNTWRGLNLGAQASIRIPDVLRFQSFRSWPDTCGWFASTPPKTSLRVSVRDHENDQLMGEVSIEGDRQPVLLPWPRGTHDKLDIVIETIGKERTPVFLANHRALSRQWLIDAAQGNGIEIGPGPQPQVLPKPGVTVSYVEQMPPEEWNRLYNGGGKYPVRPDLWDNYIVGDASDLPVEDGSLDFIFSSHVFEHLANPIGHLERWAGKIASGGKILCVVPDLAGTKDSIQLRSEMSEWLHEYETGQWEPDLTHYTRHLRRASDDPQLVAAMNRKESIHVHYYDNVNFQILAEYAVRNLGYKSYSIEHTPNHKDFHFVLVKH